MSPSLGLGEEDWLAYRLLLSSDAVVGFADGVDEVDEVGGYWGWGESSHVTFGDQE
jgi:hypothetical protein